MDFRSLKWFFLSIIAISTLFTVSSSFLLGFQNQQLFTSGSANDILVISQPKITPAQSQLPLFWIEDIHQLPGISIVSPETVDIVIDQTTGQTPYFRGVTNNFINITSHFTMLQGHFFNSDQNSTKPEIVVGKNYANLFHIKVGDTLVLQSRPRTAIIDVTVAGIFSSQTIADNGLVGPLWVGRLFGGLSDNLVNIIRIKFDTSVYTKTELQNIILSNHKITIKVTNPFKYAADISKSSVVLFNRFKEKINESLVNSQNEVDFTVPFGQYYIEVVNSNISATNFESIFVTGTKTFSGVLGTKYAYFSAQFSISHEVKSNASVNIVNIDENKQYNYTTDKTGSIKGNLPLGSLQITLRWNNYINSTIINHQTNESVKINFEYAITLNLRDSSTNSSLANKKVIITNLDNNNVFNTFSNAQGLLTESLQPNTPYSIVSSDNTYARKLIISKFNESRMDVFLGAITLKVHVTDVDIGNIINYPIKMVLYNQTNSRMYSKNVLTDSNGLLIFTAMAGTSVTLSAKYGALNRTFGKNFIVNNQVNYNFYLGKQQFLLSVNDTSMQQKDLFPITVALKELTTSATTKVVVSSSQIHTLFLPVGNYSISPINYAYPFYDEFTINATRANNFEINFNNYTVEMSFFSKNDSIFSGTFKLLQKVDLNYVNLQSLTGSTIRTNLKNGLYRIVLNSNKYIFDKIFKVYNHNQRQTFVVSEVNPTITPLNFGNYSIINSTFQLLVTSKNSKLVQYKWNSSQYQTYNPSVGIVAPTNTQGSLTLTIASTNYDDTTITNVFQITIDDTGPIATLLNQNGNNSWVNYDLLPEFSFSEAPKNVYYTWNTSATTAYPTKIPNPGTYLLKVVAEDFAGNNNTFYYLFNFDINPPSLNNSNPTTNSTIYGNNVTLNFSEPLDYLQYHWTNGSYLNGLPLFNGNFFVIPVPTQDGLNYNLSLNFRDRAGNYNSTTLIFPILDRLHPNIILNSSINEIFNQSYDSKVLFTLYNSNNTLKYRWKNITTWQVINVQNNITYELKAPFINGPLELDLQIFDSYNPNDNPTKIFNFTGNFVLPQVNVSLNKSVGPGLPISIFFPSNYLNWSFNWDNLGSMSGTSSTTTNSTPTSIGNHSLNFILFDNNTSSYKYVTYLFSIENDWPYLSNTNNTFLSALNAYYLTFPSYVQTWNYTWDNQTYFYGINTSTELVIPINLSNTQFLFINYTTKYNQITYFSLNYTIDSSIPQVNLIRVLDNSTQHAGFKPTLHFLESTIQKIYRWVGMANSTTLFPMPKFPDNTLTNLTIFFEDQANNWNVTIFSFIQDNTPPNIQLDQTNKSINNNFVKVGDTLVFTTLGTNFTQVFCSWTNQITSTCNLTVPIIMFQGKIVFTIWVYDAAGNGNATSVTLNSDTIPPVLTYSALQNNTIINSNFKFAFNFSENVSSSNSLYSWDSSANNTGYPQLNTGLIGEHTLKWWFGDEHNNWNYYLFYVIIDTGLPSFRLQGNYSSSIIIANSSLMIIPFDENNLTINVYVRWNNDITKLFESISNSSIAISLPTTLGNAILHVMIRDTYNNWLNQSMSFLIKTYLSVSIVDNESNPIQNITLTLTNLFTNTVVNVTNQSYLSIFVNPASYSLGISFQNYSISSIFNLQSSSINRLISLKKITFTFNNDNSSTNNTGTIQWNTDYLTSSTLSINNSLIVYVPMIETHFRARLDNKTLFQTVNPSQNINRINFTTQLTKLSLLVTTSLKNIPIQNAIIKSDQRVIGLTDNNGLFNSSLQPGSHLIIVQYASFRYNFSIELFEKQSYKIILPVTSNISISIKNQDNSPAGNILVSLYTNTNYFIGSRITDFNGIATWNLIPWGSYKIEINLNSTNIINNITISSLSDQKGNVFTFSLPQTNPLLSAVGNNLGKWSFNRNYEVVAPSQLSDQSLANLGFSIIFSTLFLIVLIMTLSGLISILHQPIYKLKNIIRDLRRIGASEKQILSIVSFQFTLYSITLALLGYVFGFLLILLWPNIQQFPIAGMIIRPQTTNILIPLTIIVSFCAITAFFTYNYTKKEYFSKVNTIKQN